MWLRPKVVKWCLSRVGIANIGAYIGSLSEATPPLWSQTATVCIPTHTKSPHRPHLLYDAAPYEAEGGRDQRDSPAVRDK